MKKFAQTGKKFFLIAILALVLALPLATNAQVPGTNSTNTGAVNGGVPASSSTNTGSGAGGAVPQSSSTNTAGSGTAASVPGSSSNNTGAASSATVPGASSTNTGANSSGVPATSSTNTGASGAGGVPASSSTNTGANLGGTSSAPAGNGSSSPSSSGGGGAIILMSTPCVDVTYGEWKAPINGMQFRDLLGRNPENCKLTAAQEEARSRSVDGVGGEDVLGEKIYANGSLLRTPDKKIYILENGQVRHIKSLQELMKYRGQTIYNIDQSTLSKYTELLTHSNGALLRGPDKKIYVLTNGRLVHIKTLKELAKYKGKRINNVSNDALSLYKGIGGQIAYNNGSLLRGPDKKIYVLENGKMKHIRSLRELLKYKGKTINNVSSDIINNYPRIS